MPTTQNSRDHIYSTGTGVEPMAGELRTALDMTLTRAELVAIASFLDEETVADEDAVRLLIGDGHDGYGLYAASPDYPDEGAFLVKQLPSPDGVVTPEGSRNG